jgi:hypothetical protein
VWLAPRLRAEITYAEVMQGWLRDPMFRRLRSSSSRRVLPDAPRPRSVVPLDSDLAAEPARRRRVVGAGDFDAAVEMHGARRKLAFKLD